MSNCDPSSEYQRVAEANRQFYARVASLYDARTRFNIDLVQVMA
jgi:hypothetical protein